jgi:glycosyltransferase involved in cell wall biosynthesis
VRLVHVTTVPESLFFLRGQPRYFRALGLEEVALSSPGAELRRFGEEEGIQTLAVPMARAVSPLRDLRALVRLVRALRRLRPAIVHAHTPKGGLLGMLAASLTRVPVRIYHVHGLPFLTARGLRRALLRWSDRVSCRLAHQVLCVSPSVREVVVREEFCAASRIEVLLSGSINGVDAAHQFAPRPRAEARALLGIAEDALVIGFVGRLVRDKGVVELCAAFETLRAQFEDLHLLVVGPFEESGLPLAALRSDRVHLCGFQTALAPFYAAMDLVALPSYREGFPVVPLEAAAMGLPVVATRIPGCVDAVVDGVTGLLVPPGDAAALTAAIRALLVDRSRARALGAAGRARVLRAFQPEAMWGALAGVYRRLLHRSAFA